MITSYITNGVDPRYPRVCFSQNHTALEFRCLVAKGSDKEHPFLGTKRNKIVLSNEL